MFSGSAPINVANSLRASSTSSIQIPQSTPVWDNESSYLRMASITSRDSGPCEQLAKCTVDCRIGKRARYASGLNILGTPCRCLCQKYIPGQPQLWKDTLISECPHEIWPTIAFAFGWFSSHSHRQSLIANHTINHRQMMMSPCIELLLQIKKSFTQSCQICMWMGSASWKKDRRQLLSIFLKGAYTIENASFLSNLEKGRMERRSLPYLT